MTQRGVPQAGSRGPATSGRASGSARAWALLAVAAFAAIVVIIALSPLGARYVDFVATAFGQRSPTCASPGDLSRMGVGDVDVESSTATTTTYTFSGGKPDLRLVCIEDRDATRVTLSTDAGTKTTAVTPPASPSATVQVGVAQGPTSKAVLHVAAVGDASTSSSVEAHVANVVFYFASP